MPSMMSCKGCVCGVVDNDAFRTLSFVRVRADECGR